ncbi:MAG: nucleotidyltransferase substrate binding protein [Deltaproteobacteria bacterium]|nr:nucleotidyltransferase substrate binding protein [Deltaproteobacteria bacterium]
MEKSKLKLIFKNFEEALDRLEEALQENCEKNVLALDGSIQRFEFCYELCWKSLKRALEMEGISTKTPREVFKAVFKAGWLKEGDLFWEEMIEDRNETSHTYDHEIAMKIYNHLPRYLTAFQKLLSALKKRYVL